MEFKRFQDVRASFIYGIGKRVATGQSRDTGVEALLIRFNHNGKAIDRHFAPSTTD
jgi:hypothetical protein